jgi:hypothetical protein
MSDQPVADAATNTTDSKHQNTHALGEIWNQNRRLRLY